MGNLVFRFALAATVRDELYRSGAGTVELAAIRVGIRRRHLWWCLQALQDFEVEDLAKICRYIEVPYDTLVSKAMSRMNARGVRDMDVMYRGFEELG